MNFKNEFINFVGERTIECVHIIHTRADYFETIDLVRFYTTLEWEYFISQLDFDYNNSSEHQTIFGTIWFSDGNWANRIFSDGLEWWSTIQRPKIPNFLLLHERVRDAKMKDFLEE